MAEVTTHRWWYEADQFDWFTAYLTERGLQTQWRAMTFLYTVTLAAIPITLTASPTGPDRPATIAASVIAAICAVASGLPWLARWPTRRQSVRFAMVSTGVIAATCLSQSSAYAALMGCVAFAIIGGFVAYFHTAVLMAANLVVSLTCAAIGTCRLIVDTGDIALAASAALIVVSLNVGVPFGIHSLAHSLRRDLSNSGHDPLTGLLNRRSFYRSVHELVLREQGRTDGHLTVVLIDLDHFKKVNDTHGHLVGDQALAAVGTVLREICRASAVIGRLGGEEFVIADSSGATTADGLAERLRCEIAAVPYGITASIGTASAPLTSTTANPNGLIDKLIHAADAAMYTAKRAGGNRVSHQAQWPDA